MLSVLKSDFLCCCVFLLSFDKVKILLIKVSRRYIKVSSKKKRRYIEVQRNQTAHAIDSSCKFPIESKKPIYWSIFSNKLFLHQNNRLWRQRFITDHSRDVILTIIKTNTVPFFPNSLEGAQRNSPPHLLLRFCYLLLIPALP